MAQFKRLHMKQALKIIESIPLPTKLDIDNCKIAAITCKTTKEFCDFLELEPIVFKQWCKQSIEYYRAYMSWRDFATNDIEVALAKKAIGFTKKTNKDVIDKLGNVHTLTNETYYPPDPTAAQFWLKNRSPEDWKDKSEVDINVQANIRAWLVSAGEADSDLMLNITPEPLLEDKSGLEIIQNHSLEPTQDELLLEPTQEESLNIINDSELIQADPLPIQPLNSFQATAKPVQVDTSTPAWPAPPPKNVSPENLADAPGQSGLIYDLFGNLV